VSPAPQAEGESHQQDTLDHCVRPDPQDYGQRSRRARLVDAEVHRIISGSHAEARRLLVEHREPLDALAAGLLERETLNEQEILQITGLSPAPALDNELLVGTAPNGTLRVPVHVGA
jgi:ATP-dependent Zn protease